jgi:hypothetical protein
VKMMAGMVLLKSFLLCFGGQHGERQDFAGIVDGVSTWEHDAMPMTHPMGGGGSLILLCS